MTFRLLRSTYVDDIYATLPPAALVAFAEVVVVLEIAPWSGAPYRSSNPEGPLRTLARGSLLVTYLILDDRREVDVVMVTWGD